MNVCIFYRYSELYGKGKSKQNICTEAAAEWVQKYKAADSTEFEAFLRTGRPKAELYPSRKRDFGFVKLETNETKDNSGPGEPKTKEMKTDVEKPAVPNKTSFLKNINTANESMQEHLDNVSKMKVIKLLSDLGISDKLLLTDDVLAEQNFVSVVRSFAYEYCSYMHMYNSYISGQERQRKSKLSEMLFKIDATLKTVADNLKSICDIQLSDSVLSLKILSETATRKLNLLSEAAISIARAQALVSDPQLRFNLRRRLYQQSETKETFRTKHSADFLKFEALNSLELSWQDAMTVLQDNHKNKGPLSTDKLLKVADIIQSESYVSIEALMEALYLNSEDAPPKNDIVCLLLQYFPVLLIQKCSVSYVTDMHEFYIAGGLWDDILLSANDKGADEETIDGDTGISVGLTSCENDRPNEKATQITETEFPPDERLKRDFGMQTCETDTCSNDNEKCVQTELSLSPHAPKNASRSIVSKFPEIVPRTQEFLQQNGFAASNRRRSETGLACGVSLNMIKEHLFKTVPGLERHGMSVKSVHRLFVAPRKGSIAGKSHLGVVDARIPGKDNSGRKENNTVQHYHAANVKFKMECAKDNNELIDVISVDNMNKIKVGTLAVSRYHQIRRFFLNSDAPKYPDHDFPVPGYHLTPSGYMFLSTDGHENVENSYQATGVATRSVALQHYEDFQKDIVDVGLNENENENVYTLDKRGKKHLKMPRSGPAHVVSRASVFYTSTVETHMNDLYPLFNSAVENGKRCFVILADNGPDWSVKSLGNVLSFCRLFKDTKCDLLCITSYAPGFSALNPIEHLWSVLSNLLTSVTFSAILSGEEKPPVSQSGLTDRERSQKEISVFDTALRELCLYWNGHKFDGYSINASFSPSDVSSMEAKYAMMYNDHDELWQFLKAPIKDIRAGKYKNYMKELKFCVDHLHKHIGQLVYTKCQNRACTHCTTNQTKTPQTVTQLLNLTPITDPQNTDHFLSYLEVKEIISEGQPLPDQHNHPHYEHKCPICNHFEFHSKTEKERHYSVLHRMSATSRQQTEVPEALQADTQCVKKKYPCGFTDCAESFKTVAQLQTHKFSTGHINIYRTGSRRR